jgi:hypothetical protein
LHNTLLFGGILAKHLTIRLDRTGLDDPAQGTESDRNLPSTACSRLWYVILQSTRYVSLPELNSQVHPSFGIGACAKSKSMPCIFIPAIFDIYSGILQILYTPFHCIDVGDSIVSGYGNESRREVTRIA